MPHVAVLAETEPSRLAGIYRDNTRVLVLFTFPAFALLIAWAGGFSWLLAGAYQPEFVFLLTLLSMGWGANVFTGPAYFTNLGTGQVRWNTLSNVLMGMVNTGLSWLLGSRYGAQGVACAYVIAIVTGSAVLVGAYRHSNRLRWEVGLAHEHLPLVIVSLLVAALGWLAPLQKMTGEPVLLLLGLLLPPLALSASVWLHPLRRQLLASLLPRRKVRV